VYLKILNSKDTGKEKETEKIRQQIETVYRKDCFSVQLPVYHKMNKIEE